MRQEDKQDVYRRAGLANRLGFGHKPALVVVDMQIGFTDPEQSVLAGNLDNEVIVINRLIAAARPHAIPIIFAAIELDPIHQADGGLWVEKIPTLRHFKRGSIYVEIDPRMQRQADDLIIVKQYASAFFGTPLAPALTAQGIDTLLVTGCTTSGCVRATVIDAISHGFRPIIPLEAVGDRAQEPHDASLFDMGSKYGDVLPVEEVIHYLDGCSSSSLSARIFR
jgi:maleamate amidohydrolase